MELKDLPCAAYSSGHVRDIEGKKAVVVSCIAHDAHTVSAGAIDNVGAVHAHVDDSIRGVDVAIVGRRCLIDVVHKTSSRICGLKQALSPIGWYTYAEAKGNIQ